MKNHLVIACVIGCLLFLQNFSAAADPAYRPNIILMMADDMGMGDTSAYQDVTGNGDEVQLHTPQMERLARMGVRMTDAHTPSSRCSPTRYGLMTGRYPWRNRLKYWVLFGSQGDPMIESDRPTLASMLREKGYVTAMVGKWHVGLRYRKSDGAPAAGWQDADLKQPLHTTPIDHGFDYAWLTSRSHGTSGPDAGAKGKKKKGNGPNQNIGPGHIDGRNAIGATDNGKQLIRTGSKAYVLTKLGSRHSDRAIRFLEGHVTGPDTRDRPFFLYYPSNSNHGPYTPDQSINGVPVAGAARTKADQPMDARHDFVYENDVALGRMLDWLEQTDDPRNQGRKLIETTLVIFTSDNGAEKNSDIATGPFRSNKGSVYEGGHRVPLMAAWSEGGIGDGNSATPGITNPTPMGLQDLYATFAEIIDSPLPDPRRGEKGAEDSFSVLAAFRGEQIKNRPPLFFNDHKEAKDDPAVAALRLDSPSINGRVSNGKWKLFFDAKLIRNGVANPIELYNLADDQWETENLIARSELKTLVEHLKEVALLHRTAAGHRLAKLRTADRISIDFAASGEMLGRIAGSSNAEIPFRSYGSTVTAKISAHRPSGEAKFTMGESGLGIDRGAPDRVDAGESVVIEFDRDVIVESAAIVAGDAGTCGGYYRVGDASPLAVYCVDADNDSKDQSGILSDIGVVRVGQTLVLASGAHFGVEAEGNWNLQAITFRVLED